MANLNKVVTHEALEDFAKRIPTMGNPNNSVGLNGIAFGEEAVSGENCFAFNGTATGKDSAAIHGKATGTNSVGLGGDASGQQSVAIGDLSEAALPNAIGIRGRARGQNSIALGANSSTQRTGQIAIGHGAQCGAKAGQVVIGPYNEIDDNASFIIGGGTADNSRKTLMKIINGVLYLPKKVKEFTPLWSSKHSITVGEVAYQFTEEHFVQGKLSILVSPPSVSTDGYTITIPIIGGAAIGQASARSDERDIVTESLPNIGIATCHYAEVAYSYDGERTIIITGVAVYYTGEQHGSGSFPVAEYNPSIYKYKAESSGISFF